jgi:hypothetical protein
MSLPLDAGTAQLTRGDWSQNGMSTFPTILPESPCLIGPKATRVCDTWRARSRAVHPVPRLVQPPKTPTAQRAPKSLLPVSLMLPSQSQVVPSTHVQASMTPTECATNQAQDSVREAPVDCPLSKRRLRSKSGFWTLTVQPPILYPESSEYPAGTIKIPSKFPAYSTQDVNDRPSRPTGCAMHNSRLKYRLCPTDYPAPDLICPLGLFT